MTTSSPIDASTSKLGLCVASTLKAAAAFWILCLLCYLSIDKAAERLVRHSGLRNIAGYFGHVGSWEVLIPVLVLVGLILLAVTRKLTASTFFVLSYVVAAIVTSVLKTAVARHEPLDKIGDLGRSFPSGHTAQSAAVYFAIVFVAYMLSWTGRKYFLYGAIALSGIAGLSLYLRDAHWMSDLFAGYAVGFSSIAIASVFWLPKVRSVIDRIQFPKRELVSH